MENQRGRMFSGSVVAIAALLVVAGCRGEGDTPPAPAPEVVAEPTQDANRSAPIEETPADTPAVPTDLTEPPPPDEVLAASAEDNLPAADAEAAMQREVEELFADAEMAITERRWDHAAAVLDALDGLALPAPAAERLALVRDQLTSAQAAADAVPDEGEPAEPAPDLSK